MILKKFLGEIMHELGFITHEQLEQSLKKQRKIFEQVTLPEFLERDKLIREARIAKEADTAPRLGQILKEMGFATDSQLMKALREQESFVDIYKAIGSEKLGIAVEIISMINSTLNVAEVLYHLMRHANRVTGSVSSTLMLLDLRTNELVFSVPTGPKSDKLVDIRIPSGEGIAGWVAETGQYTLVSDVSNDPRFYPEIDKITGLKTKSILCVPLKAKSKLIGVLEVINKTDGTVFSEEDAVLLSIFASQAAMAIENARLYGELKDRLKEEREMQKKLAETEKFSALGQLASGLAHDFNNILGAIMGYVEMALYDLEEENLARQSMEQVLIASRRAKDLVRQILAFSRRSENERKPTRLSAVIREVSTLLRASTPSNIEIVQKIEDDASAISADPSQMHQVLMNLCTNAHHAMREKGGRLEVSLSSIELREEDAADFSGLAPGSYLKLGVEDTGHGMDDKTLERAFEPYFTTKEKDVGTGMGLAVVQGIVNSHHGSIRVKSEIGRGTRFDILFPKIEKKMLPENETMQNLPTGTERILFLDDEAPLVDIGKHMLERLGYQVVGITSPKEALDAFKANPDYFHLVITDMTMPYMNGDVFAESLMQIRPDIPVILCTGYSDLINKEKALQKALKGFLMKPHSIRDLAGTVRRVLDE
ncbi:MAG: response regulator [Desulfobacteraceae bacterium]|nr:MAG: response regulator [Desulfobacteraceae bacterium]